MNRKQRRAKGIKTKKGDAVIVGEAIEIARELTRKRLYDEARNLYLKILKFSPENETALLDLGIAAIRDNQLDDAEMFVNQTLRLNARHCGALTLLAELKIARSDLDGAFRLVEKVLTLAPSPQILNRLGVIFIAAGQFDRGRQYLEQAIERKPDYIEAYYHLKPLKKFTESDIQHLGAIEGQKQISLEEKIWLEFTVGNAYLDIGDADAAFRSLREANALKRATYNYNVADFERYVDSIISLFNESLVEKLKERVESSSQCPIFIVGLPRSGSTLIDQILSSHPFAGSLGESRNFEKCIPLFPNAEVPGFFGPAVASITRQFIECLTPELLKTMASAYMSAVDPSVRGKPYVIDKMPFNYLTIGLLRLAFPNCKVVHSMRDPVDTGLSIWRLLFEDDIMWAYDLAEIGRYTTAYQKLMAHWRKLFPGEIHDLQYENMVADQEAETRKLLEFCALPWHDDCLRFHETERRVGTASATQVRQPIYKDSVKKWKKYEQHLRPLIDSLP